MDFSSTFSSTFFLPINPALSCFCFEFFLIPTNEDEDDEIDMGDEVEEVGFEKDDSEDDDF
jgi:hypothetical protein